MEESAKGQQGKQIPWRQFASQLLGLVLGSEPGSTTHSSTLLWEEEKEGSLLLPISASGPTHLTLDSTPPAPRQGAEESFPAPLTNLPGPSLPA